MLRQILSTLIGSFALVMAVQGTAIADSFLQTNLITSGADPDLINPWGVSSSAGSPFWVSDNGTGKATLYNSAGVKQGLVVSMPAGSEPITGTVFNGTATFNGNLFMFASENGTIAGWRGALGTTAETMYSTSNAVYKGLAISTAKDRLFAANFHSGAIDVFDSTHSSAIGSFIDPNAPAGYAPFNIQNVGGKLYTTFAVQDGTGHDDVAGPGNGLVDVFDPTTDTFTRLVTGGVLNSPWGVAIAPGSFGSFAGDLLVGNFGDGTINAFNPTTGVYLGTLRDASNNPIVNPGLWGLIVGNGGNGGSPNSLYFTAGGANEDVGLFGRLDSISTPTPSAVWGIPMLLGLLGVNTARRRRAS